MNNRHAVDPPPFGHFALSVNMICNGKFLSAGVSMPLRELASIPANLRLERYIIRHPSNSEPEPEPEPSLTFTLGTPYSVDSEGRRRTRNLQREAIALDRAQQETEEIENALAAEPDAQVKAALEVAEERHQAAVDFQIAEATVAAKRREMDNEAARQFAEEDPMLVDDHRNLPVSPTIVEPKPKRMRKRYVRHGQTWLRAMRVSCHIGESVYVRNGPGDFEKIGIIGSDGSLPVVYIKEKAK